MGNRKSKIYPSKTYEFVAHPGSILDGEQIWNF